MMSITEVPAKVLKRITENDKELSVLVYMEVLGFVTASVKKNPQLLSKMMSGRETKEENYQSGLPLQISGAYDFDTRKLSIFEYRIQKDA